MNFKLINEDKIRISLSIEDMRRLDITFDEFDYANINTRRVIWTLLCEAKESLCPELDLFSKMLIEIFPEANGGCDICFTILGNTDPPVSRLSVKKNIKPCVFEFKNADKLILAFEQKLPIPDTFFENCELFLIKKRYRLIVNNLGKSLSALPDYLNEFGSYIGEGREIVAYTREHGVKIADSGGIKRMAVAFRRPETAQEHDKR